MRFTLKNSKFIQNVAFGATAIATLAGVGLTSSPAQAALLRLTPNPSHVPAGQSEIVGGTTPAEYWREGQNGYDNAIIEVTGNPGERVDLRFDYLGDGTATESNFFQWEGANLFGPVPGNSDWQPCGLVSGGTNCWNGNPDNSGNFVASAVRTVTLGDDGTLQLPFQYIVDRTGANFFEIPNGLADDSTQNPHYFAVLGSTSAPDQSYPFDLNFTCPEEGCTSDLVGFGLNDRPFEGVDNDASDSTLKITVVSSKVPEPTTVLGLLAVGSLGLALKRKKQEG